MVSLMTRTTNGFQKGPRLRLEKGTCPRDLFRLVSIFFNHQSTGGENANTTNTRPQARHAQRKPQNQPTLCAPLARLKSR